MKDCLGSGRLCGCNFIMCGILLLLLLPTWCFGQLGNPPNGGFPNSRGSFSSLNDADLPKAITAYRFWYPTVSCEGIFNGNREHGIRDNETFIVLSAGPRHLAFTANSDTPYAAGTLDLSAGPMMIELPPGPFIALANDHHQRWIMDMGLPGPDAGKGGTHAIVPPDETATILGVHQVRRSSSYKVMVAIRALPQNGNVAAALDALRSVKIYPAMKPDQLVKFLDITQDKMDGTLLRWEDNLQYWEVLHRIIDAEPVVEGFRPMYGLLADLGIEKGQPFAPDERRKNLLIRAAREARDQMLVTAFASERPERMAWPDRKWEWVGLVDDNADFRTPWGMDLNARDRWFVQAIVASPAMFRRSPGSGSLYWLGLRSADGQYLNGGKSYKLTVPLPVPAKLFWSVTAYDAATRSEVQAPQDRAALRSLVELTPEKLGANEKSVDLYFGPEPPASGAEHWIQTVPGKGWFTYFRIYGPEQPAFDGSWKPGDFQEVK